MKILLLPHLPDPARRSMDAYVGELEHHIFPRLTQGESIFHFQPAVDSIHHGLAGKLQRYYQQYVQYQRDVARQKADVFHITDHGYAHLVSSLPSQRVVVTFHDALLLRLDKASLPVQWKPRCAIWAQRRCLNAIANVGQVIVDSEAVEAELKSFLSSPGPPVAVVQLGLDPTFRLRQPSRALERLRRRFALEKVSKVLVVGRSDPHKNVEGTLTVFARVLREKRIDATLLKIGSDFSPDQRRLSETLGISSKVRYLGAVPREDLPGLYSVSDVLLHLSLYEGFGFPVLEAMACGTPVVASDIPALQEIARGAAVFVDPLNEEAAVEAVAGILEGRIDTAPLIEKGKRRAAEFTWEKTARKTLEIYREVYERTRA